MLELDELWSFVCKKAAKRWLWIALCRRTRQIVAFVIGDRSEKTCRRLWNKIPESYRICPSFSDFWDAYQKVFSAESTSPSAKRVARPPMSSAGTTRSATAGPLRAQDALLLQVGRQSPHRHQVVYR